MGERRDSRNRRAAAYQRALARLRNLHPQEFEQLYADERAGRTTTTDDAAAR